MNGIDQVIMGSSADRVKAKLQIGLKLWNRQNKNRTGNLTCKE